MIHFLGNIDAKVDVKGRVFIPVTFRKQLQLLSEEYFIIRKDVFQDCLVLYPYSIWQKEVETLRAALNKWNKEQQQLFRQFVVNAEQVELDSNGRILIPKRYLQMVGISSDIRFLGVDNTIEIWSKEKLNNALINTSDFSEAIQNIMSQKND